MAFFVLRPQVLRTMVHPDTIMYHQQPGPDSEYRLMMELRGGMGHRYLIVPEGDDECFKMFSCVQLMPKLLKVNCDLIQPIGRCATDQLYYPKVTSPPPTLRRLATSESA